MVAGIARARAEHLHVGGNVFLSTKTEEKGMKRNVKGRSYVVDKCNRKRYIYDAPSPVSPERVRSTVTYEATFLCSQERKKCVKRNVRGSSYVVNICSIKTDIYNYDTWLPVSPERVRRACSYKATFLCT